MARMFEMLKKGDGPRPGASSPKPAADDCVIDWAVGEAQVPYIEVGGPGKLVEGSAEVMAVTHPAQLKQPPHPPTGKALAAQSVLLAQLTDAKPLTIAFEPWTGPIAGSTGIAPEIIAFHQPAHPISKQYAEVWNTMIAGLPGIACPTLLLTGLRSQVGTTTVILNLAVTGAAQQRRVVIVDAQMRQPGVAPRLGIKPELGLLDVIAGQAALEQTMVKTLVPSLHALPLANRRDDVTITSEAAAWLVGRLRERFDAVLIDGPNLTEASALTALAPCCDALFLVAPQGETNSLPRDSLLTIARLGGKLRGLLHTHFEL